MMCGARASRSPGRAEGERDEDDAQGEEVRSDHEGLDPAVEVHGV